MAASETLDHPKARRAGARRSAHVGAILSLALHVGVLGASFAAEIPLGEADDFDPGQQYLLSSLERPLDPDASRMSSSRGIGILDTAALEPGSERERAAEEVRRCFGDDGAAHPATAARPAPAAIVELRNVVVRGPIDSDEADRTLSDSRERFQACYERALRDTPALRGRVSVALSVSPDAIESTIRATGGAEAQDALRCCLAGAQDRATEDVWAPAPARLAFTAVLRRGG